MDKEQKQSIEKSCPLSTDAWINVLNSEITKQKYPDFLLPFGSIAIVVLLSLITSMETTSLAYNSCIASNPTNLSVSNCKLPFSLTIISINSFLIWGSFLFITIVVVTIIFLIEWFKTDKKIKAYKYIRDIIIRGETDSNKIRKEWEKINMTHWNIKNLKAPIAIAAIVAILSAIVYLDFGNKPETFNIIATISLVVATVYIAYFNMQVWLAQDRPWLRFNIKQMDWAGGEKSTWLSVTNIGKGPALDVRFRINDRDYNYNSLTPGQEQPLSYPIGTYPLPKGGIKITNISYKDIHNNRLSQDDQPVFS